MNIALLLILCFWAKRTRYSSCNANRAVIFAPSEVIIYIGKSLRTTQYFSLLQITEVARGLQVRQTSNKHCSDQSDVQEEWADGGKKWKRGNVISLVLFCGTISIPSWGSADEFEDEKCTWRHSFHSASSTQQGVMLSTATRSASLEG